MTNPKKRAPREKKFALTREQQRQLVQVQPGDPIADAVERHGWPAYSRRGWYVFAAGLS